MPLLEIGWTPEEGNLATSYNVYYRIGDDDADSWVRMATGVSEPVRRSFPTTYDKIEFAVAPIVGGIEANEEDWTVSEYTPASKAELVVPDDVASLGIGQLGNLLSLRWDAVSPAPHHYEIREGSPDWDDGRVIQKPAGTRTSTTFGWGTSGSQSYMIKAVDAAGNESANPTSATVVVQESQYEVTKATTNEHSGGYGGTKTDMEVVTSNLYIKKAPSSANGWTDNADTYDWPPMLPHLGDGTYVTDASDAGSVVYEKIDVNLTVEKEDPLVGQKAADWRMIVRPKGNISADSRTTLDRIYANENLVEGPQYTVEIDTTPDDPAGTPTWDGWRLWVPEAIYQFRGVRLRITVTSYWFWWWKLTGFTWKRRRENRKDEQTVTLSATGGTDVTFTTTFTEAPKVTATVITNTALLAVVDTITSSGCKVYVFNTSGTEQASGTVHIQSLGA